MQLGQKALEEAADLTTDPDQVHASLNLIYHHLIPI